MTNAAIKHILVPTDFGAASQHALDVAVELAKTLGATITIFHASFIPPSVYAPELGNFAWPIEEMEASARKDLVAAVTAAKARYPRVESVMVPGEPWEMILEQIKKAPTDLVVMGTHGRRGVSRLLLGSVAERTVRMSPVPVLTVPTRPDEAKLTSAA